MISTNQRPADNCPSTNQRMKSGRHDAATKVVAAFNTWAFKREQPSDIAHLTETVRLLVELQQPVEFVLYWGKGQRGGLGSPDVECLDYLAAFAERIRAVYQPGARIRLICTDTHARLNGHARSSTMSYFLAVGEAASARGFSWCLLGDVVRGQSRSIPAERPTARPASTISQLERSAARWYRGDGNPLQGAIAYYDMNMAEKQAVELEFPHAIFITFSSREMRDLFPDRLPVFYMYSVRKGVGVKPWFIDDGAARGALVAQSRIDGGASAA
jgi:hypothetical protein